MIDPALQPLPEHARPTAAGTRAAATVLHERSTIDAAFEAVGEHLLSLDRVDSVAISLIAFPPGDDRPWTALGGRAWLREWRHDDGPVRIVPPPGAGPEAALSMPWMSQRARHGVVALPDVGNLPPEAEQDARELAGGNAGAIVATSQVIGDVMVGSMSAVSATAGPWPDDHLADFRLLHSALTARMTIEHQRRSLHEAVRVGEQARESQQQFFAALGHELRTPIAAVTAYAEVLADEAADAAARDAGTTEVSTLAELVRRDSSVILRASEQLLAVVEDLLSTGRLAADEHAVEDVDVADAVRDVLHWHRATAAPRGVRVTSHVAPGTTVRARPAAFRQALTNLIGNAIVHNVQGGTVEVSTEALRGEHGELRVRTSVHDDGPGLDDEQLVRAFQPFVRYAGEQTPGTGLGLSLTRTLVERDGGSLGAASVPGDGSVFWVDLPAGTGAEA